ARRLHGLHAVGAEVQIGSALRLAVDAALELLAELGSLGGKHGSLLSPVAVAAITTIAAVAPLAAFTAAARRHRVVEHALLMGHRVVLHDLAAIDPHLDAAGAVGGHRRRLAVVDIGAERVQRHAALAIPLHARDLGAAQAAAAIDADAEGAQAHRRLHRALHRAAERDAALQLLRDVLGDEGRLDLGLPDLEDVERHLGAGALGHFLAQRLDVGALL